MGKETAWSTYQFIVNTNTSTPITSDKTFKNNKGPLNSNSKKVVYLLECKKCRNLYVGKAQTNFIWGWIIITVLTNSSKVWNEKHRNFFTDIICSMIMKIRTIGNSCWLTNALLMLKLGKEMFIGNIVLKCSFQMTVKVVSVTFSLVCFDFNFSDIQMSWYHQMPKHEVRNTFHWITWAVNTIW